LWFSRIKKIWLCILQQVKGIFKSSHEAVKAGFKRDNHKIKILKKE